MKVVTLGPGAGLQRIDLSDQPDPGKPARGQLRVRISGVSLNYHDYGVVVSDPPRSVGRVPMADGAGVIEAVGEDVAEFSVGDHVMSTFFPEWLDGSATHSDFATVPGDGVDGYASEVVLRPATWFTHAPRGWSHVEAATLPTAGVTAWRALVGDGKLKAGATVLILGTGGVSMFCLQLVKLMGGFAFVTSSSDQKLEKVRSLGADATVNYKKDAEWGASVRRMTGGRGVDHVIEMGGPGTLPQSIEAVCTGGRISLIGTVTGYAGAIPTANLMRKQARLQGLIVGSRRQQRELIRALELSTIRPIVDRTFQGLESLPDAFRYEDSRQHVGKICLHF
jgi:NADPH:quinone reductase-like Zn-dependent oxidoreductase